MSAVRIVYSIGICMLTLCLGCGDKAMVQQTITKSDLVGEWRCPPGISDTLDGEWGPTRVRLVFEESGRMKMTITILDCPGGGGVFDYEGAYELDGNVLSWEANEREDRVITMRNGHLLMEFQDSGEVFDFVRVGTEAGE